LDILFRFVATVLALRTGDGEIVFLFLDQAFAIYASLGLEFRFGSSVSFVGSFIQLEQDDAPDKSHDDSGD
jgi:hypothetical protein